MALTKLMHMKQTKGKNPSRHLRNGLAYILKDEKTEHGRWVGGNAGTTPEEAYHTMLEIKDEFGKKHGRQGYHFVISFKEDAPPEVVYKVMQDFCQDYLGDAYDYVFSVHTDSTHIHAHVIFNSVSRTTGLKYHYNNGDWAKEIQPVTDKVCKKYGFEKFTFDGDESADYGTWKRKQDGKRNWEDIVKDDIDRCVDGSKNMQEFYEKMILCGYLLRQGKSRENKVYFSVTPKGGTKAIRNSRLGKGYTVSDIQKRISVKENPFSNDKAAYVPYLKSTKTYAAKPLPSAGQTMFYPSQYQNFFIRKYCKNTILYQYQNTRNYEDIKETEKLSRNCRFLLRNHIRSQEQLAERKERLLESLDVIEIQRHRLYQDKLPQDASAALSEYLKLKRAGELMLASGNEEEWEEIDDKIKKMKSEYPLEELEQWQENRNMELAKIREQKKVLLREKKLIDEIEKSDIGYGKELDNKWRNTPRKTL